MAEFTMDDLMFKPGLMKGQRILITGGGTGLGKVMAEACALLGADVVIWGRRGNVIDATAKELSEHSAKFGGGLVTGQACDIRVPEAIHDTMDEVWAGGTPTGLIKMTMSLAVEWGNRGIRFNAIAPGPFPTEGAWARLSPGQSTSGAGKADPTIPLNRVGEMRELANLAVYLLDPGSAYVNGQTIAIDGGGYLSGRGRADLASWTDEQWEAARNAIKGANEKDRAKRTV